MSDLTTDFLSAEPEEHNFTVLPKGEYPFDILEINAFSVSKAGNDMLPLKLQFKDGNGNTSDVFENLVFTEKALFKINQFLAAVAVPKGTRINFRDPEFIKYLKAKSGSALLDVEKYTNKSGKEVEKNVVVGYVYGGSSRRDEIPAHRETPKAAPVEEEDDSDIPF